MKILIVDDERFGRAMLCRFISKRFSFCDVREAENGREALELVNQDSPDAIFLDLRMPVMNGIEMLEELRNNLLFKEIPVIITSAIQEKSIIMHLTQLGIESYLVKPIDIDTAYSRIGKILMGIQEPKVKAQNSDSTNHIIEKRHKILLVDDDPTFRKFFAAMVGNRCEVIVAKDGNEACRLAQENDNITEICISENLPEGTSLQNPRFLAKKLLEINAGSTVEMILCSERKELREDEKKIFKGIIIRTFVQKLFIESLIKKVFKDDEKEGSLRHLVISQFGERIRYILITALPSFITENVAILDCQAVNTISNEHSESIFVYVSEGKLDITVSIVGLMEHFEQLAKLKGDEKYRLTYKTNQLFQKTLREITEVFIDILNEFNYSAKVNNESWKKNKKDNNHVVIYSIPFRIGSGEEFVCRICFNDVS